MKNILLIAMMLSFFWSCNTTYTSTNIDLAESRLSEQDTVKISSDKVEYEIIIIEPGFNSWLQGRARPEGYYSQEFLENRNALYVTAWNNRVLDPTNYDSNLYQMQINYNPFTDYGYEVNYKLYYYFIYFQLQHKQQLTQLVPRI